MVGLIYLSIAALYLSLMFFVVRWAWRKGRINNGSTLKALSYAFIGFLIIYLPVFWNWIPVVLVHRSLCGKDAGFYSYMPPEKWVEKYRDQLAELRFMDLDKTTKSEEVRPHVYRYIFFGGMLVRENQSEKINKFAFDFIRSESQVFDRKSNDLISRRVDYLAGSNRFWMNLGGCAPSGQASFSDLDVSFFQRIKGEILK